jgi:hypothetical protein
LQPTSSQGVRFFQPLVLQQLKKDYVLLDLSTEVRTKNISEALKPWTRKRADENNMAITPSITITNKRIE